MLLGRVIAAERKRRGLTQTKLAAMVLREDGKSISPQYLNDIERDRRVPGPQIMAEIARVLDQDLDELHFQAGQLPPDFRYGTPGHDRVDQVAAAFRRAYATDHEDAVDS